MVFLIGLLYLLGASDGAAANPADSTETETQSSSETYSASDASLQNHREVWVLFRFYDYFGFFSFRSCSSIIYF